MGGLFQSTGQPRFSAASENLNMSAQIRMIHANSTQRRSSGKFVAVAMARRRERGRKGRARGRRHGRERAHLSIVGFATIRGGCYVCRATLDPRQLRMRCLCSRSRCSRCVNANRCQGFAINMGMCISAHTQNTMFRKTNLGACRSPARPIRAYPTRSAPMQRRRGHTVEKESSKTTTPAWASRKGGAREFRGASAATP